MNSNQLEKLTNMHTRSVKEFKYESILPVLLK